MCFQVIQAYYFSKINAWFELIKFHSFFWNLCSYNHAILHVHLKKEDVHSNVWPARRSRGAGRSPWGPRSLLAGGGACNLTAYQQGRLCVRGRHGRQNQPAAFKRSTHLLHAPCFVSGPARRLSGCERSGYKWSPSSALPVGECAIATDVRPWSTRLFYFWLKFNNSHKVRNQEYLSSVKSQKWEMTSPLWRDDSHADTCLFALRVWIWKPGRRLDIYQNRSGFRSSNPHDGMSASLKRVKPTRGKISKHVLRRN